jgi:ribose transport system substrate-binding protein
MRADLSRLLRVAFLVVAAALLLSACGGDDDSGSASTSNGSAAGSDGGGGESKGTIGFSIPQGADPSLRLLDGGIKAEAAKHGLELKTIDANLDVNKQLSDIDAFITQKMKAIVVWPMSSEAIQPALQRAQQANIPIIAIYALTDGPYYTDLIIDGKGVGADMAKFLADELGSGAKVAAINGPPQVDQFREIAEGFAAQAKTSGLDVVDTKVDPKIAPEGAADITQSFKTKHPDLKGLMLAYESGVDATAATFDDAFKPKLVTYGGNQGVLDQLKNGQVAASPYQNVVLMGRIAAWAASQAIAGEKIPEKLYIHPPLLTQDNVEGYPSTDEQLTKEYDFKPVQKDGQWIMPLFEPQQ